MLKGSTPLDPRFSSLDISPALQAGAMEQQAILDVATGINQAVQSIQEKQMQKKDQEMRMSALSPLLTESGIAGAPGTDTYNAALKQLAKSDDFLKTVTNLETARINSMVKLSEIQEAEREAEIQPFSGIEMSNPRQVVDTSIPGEPKIITVGLAKEGGIDKQGNQFYKGGEYAVINGDVKSFDPDTMISYNPVDVSANRRRLLEVQESASTAARELRGLERYLDARGRLAKGGAKRLVNQILGTLKTIAGDENLTDEQLQEKIAQGLFRQQLGNLRVAVLGPGVLTEFDRVVLEQAIGGFGAGSNIEAVTALLEPILQEKIRQVERASSTFNDVLSISPRLSREFQSFNVDNLLDETNFRDTAAGESSAVSGTGAYEGMSIVD